MDNITNTRQSLNFEEIKVTFVPRPSAGSPTVWKAPAGDGYLIITMEN